MPCQVTVAQWESRTQDHALYQESLQKSQEWLKMSAERLAVSCDVSGDKYALVSKIERIKVRY